MFNKIKIINCVFIDNNLLTLCCRTDLHFPLPDFVPGPRPVETTARHKNKRVVRISEHQVAGQKEAFFCNVTSSVVLADGRVVLCDDSNSKLKMMNPKLEFMFELDLDSNPLNLAQVSDKRLAVSIPGLRQVVFVDICPKEFQLSGSIKTRRDCWGVEVLDNVVIVTTGRDGHSVIMYDMEGTEVNSFLLTAHADENIRCPVAVTADRKKRHLYITCTGGAWSKGCVVKVDLQGTLLQVFNDPEIDTPRTCTLDKHGKLYICALESSTVYQISPSGELFRLFPSKTDQVVGPLHLNFVPNFHIRFILTEVASDTLKLFELPTGK